MIHIKASLDDLEKATREMFEEVAKGIKKDLDSILESEQDECEDANSSSSCIGMVNARLVELETENKKLKNKVANQAKELVQARKTVDNSTQSIIKLSAELSDIKKLDNTQNSPIDWCIGNCEFTNEARSKLTLYNYKDGAMIKIAVKDGYLNYYFDDGLNEMQEMLDGFKDKGDAL